jgi:Ca2+-binding RTX toxin-like protein
MAGANDVVNGLDIGDAGNSIETAASVGHSSQITGSAGFAPDTGDFYRFVPNEDGFWSATLDGLGSDLDLDLYGSNGQLLAVSNASGTNPDYVSFELTAFETYYLHVIPDGAASSAYNLRMNLIGVRPVVVGTAGDDLCDLIPFVAGTARGGPGNDLYLVDDFLDRAIEEPGEGIDTVEASLSWELADNLENLRLVGSNAVEGVGNALDNQILGNVDYNRLRGGEGNDTLDGASGNDTMDGGFGDDVYYVDNASDVVSEQSNEAQALPSRSAAFLARAWSDEGGREPPDPSAGTGSNIDTVISQVSYTLRTNIENLQLAEDGAALDLDGTGNDLDNLLAGNSGNNRLSGLAGKDILDGGKGNDTLDGGDGADTLGGGAGNDVYIAGSGDRIVEASGGGTDTVRASATWVLANNVERLVLEGAGALNGTGNTLANTLTGNAAANALSGAAGADVLQGLAGNDVLRGGSGNDRLSGGSGADAFVFETALSASANKDLITDFVHGTDRIRLDDDVFSALVPGALTAAQFRSGAGVTTAGDASDRILYNTTTGALYYDRDGTGAAAAPVVFAVLGSGSHPALTAADFVIVG